MKHLTFLEVSKRLGVDRTRISAWLYKLNLRSERRGDQYLIRQVDYDKLAAYQQKINRKCSCNTKEEK